MRLYIFILALFIYPAMASHRRVSSPFIPSGPAWIPTLLTQKGLDSGNMKDSDISYDMLPPEMLQEIAFATAQTSPQSLLNLARTSSTLYRLILSKKMITMCLEYFIYKLGVASPRSGSNAEKIDVLNLDETNEVKAMLTLIRFYEQLHVPTSFIIDMSLPSFNTRLAFRGVERLVKSSTVDWTFPRLFKLFQVPQERVIEIAAKYRSKDVVPWLLNTHPEHVPVTSPVVVHAEELLQGGAKSMWVKFLQDHAELRRFLRITGAERALARVPLARFTEFNYALHDLLEDAVLHQRV